MSTSTDPLATWLGWLEQQQLKGSDDPQGAPAPWRLSLDQSLEDLARTLSDATDWQTTLATHVQEAAADASRLAASIPWPPVAELDWLTRLFRSDTELGNHGQGTLARGLFGQLSRWPALGLAAANEQDWHALQESLPAARSAWECYTRTLLAMMIDALARWKNGLEEMDGPPADAEQLREHWLNALEDAWQAMIEDPEHARRLLEFNMAMDRVRTCGARVADGMFRAFGIPTREDLQGTQRRLQEVRRKLRASDTATELAMLREDVKALQAEMAALRGRPDPATGRKQR